METRNIIDHYHYWEHDAILSDLDNKRFNYSVVCCNIGNDILYIPQYGSVRSINVGTASGILMNSYCSKITQTLGLGV